MLFSEKLKSSFIIKYTDKNAALSTMPVKISINIVGEVKINLKRSNIHVNGKEAKAKFSTPTPEVAML